jgi:hypothetical protein
LHSLKTLTSTLDNEELSKHVTDTERSVKDLTNLSQTMSSLMRSVLEEVDSQRRDMLRVIEDVASIEILS